MQVWGTHIAAKMLPNLVDQHERRLYHPPTTKGWRHEARQGGLTPQSPASSGATEGMTAVVGVVVDTVSVNPLGMEEEAEGNEDEGEV